MEGKKKFEKPQMEVLKLKPAGIICDSCTSYCPGVCLGNCGCNDQCEEN